MYSNNESENTLLNRRHVLILPHEDWSFVSKKYREELNNLRMNFCGIIVKDFDELKTVTFSPESLIYLCGSISEYYDKLNMAYKTLFVIKELSQGYENFKNDHKLISVGKVPLSVNDVGVYIRDFFSVDKDYFDKISGEHQFQDLTESNKSDSAFRKGIYLTKIEEVCGELLFRLLRCSSNLNGPTDNLRSTDQEVIGLVDEFCQNFFEQRTTLNHVLAQIYKNRRDGGKFKNKEKKAKINAHSDKTKDMPRNGLIAFCSFYENYSTNGFKNAEYKQSNTDIYDHCINGVTVLTKLHFKLKKVNENPHLKKNFFVTLYPNSVFVMSLDMNRLYTHEIAPSALPIDKIPIRMGYVIRCSKTDAVFKDDQTYVFDENNKKVKLQQPDTEGVEKLKKIYKDENSTDDMIYYDKFYFSLNQGDYKKPIL